MALAPDFVLSIFHDLAREVPPAVPNSVPPVDWPGWKSVMRLLTLKDGPGILELVHEAVCVFSEAEQWLDKEVLVDNHKFDDLMAFRNRYSDVLKRLRQERACQTPVGACWQGEEIIGQETVILQGHGEVVLFKVWVPLDGNYLYVTVFMSESLIRTTYPYADAMLSSWRAKVSTGTLSPFDPAEAAASMAGAAARGSAGMRQSAYEENAGAALRAEAPQRREPFAGHGRPQTEGPAAQAQQGRYTVNEPDRMPVAESAARGGEAAQLVVEPQLQQQQRRQRPPQQPPSARPTPSRSGGTDQGSHPRFRPSPGGPSGEAAQAQRPEGAQRRKGSGEQQGVQPAQAEQQPGPPTEERAQRARRQPPGQRPLQQRPPPVYSDAADPSDTYCDHRAAGALLQAFYDAARRARGRHLREQFQRRVAREEEVLLREHSARAQARAPHEAPGARAASAAQREAGQRGLREHSHEAIAAQQPAAQRRDATESGAGDRDRGAESGELKRPGKRRRVEHQLDDAHTDKGNKGVPDALPPADQLQPAPLQEPASPSPVRRHPRSAEHARAGLPPPPPAVATTAAAAAAAPRVAAPNVDQRAVDALGPTHGNQGAARAPVRAEGLPVNTEGFAAFQETEEKTALAFGQVLRQRLEQRRQQQQPPSAVPDQQHQGGGRSPAQPVSDGVPLSARAPTAAEQEQREARQRRPMPASFFHRGLPRSPGASAGERPLAASSPEEAAGPDGSCCRLRKRPLPLLVSRPLDQVTRTRQAGAAAGADAGLPTHAPAEPAAQAAVGGGPGPEAAAAGGSAPPRDAAGGSPGPGPAVGGGQVPETAAAGGSPARGPADDASPCVILPPAQDPGVFGLYEADGPADPAAPAHGDGGAVQPDPAHATSRASDAAGAESPAAGADGERVAGAANGTDAMATPSPGLAEREADLELWVARSSEQVAGTSVQAPNQLVQCTEPQAGARLQPGQVQQGPQPQPSAGQAPAGRSYPSAAGVEEQAGKDQRDADGRRPAELPMALLASQGIQTSQSLLEDLVAQWRQREGAGGYEAAVRTPQQTPALQQATQLQPQPQAQESGALTSVSLASGLRAAEPTGGGDKLPGGSQGSLAATVGTVVGVTVAPVAGSQGQQVADKLHRSKRLANHDSNRAAGLEAGGGPSSQPGNACDRVRKSQRRAGEPRGAPSKRRAPADGDVQGLAAGPAEADLASNSQSASQNDGVPTAGVPTAAPDGVPTAAPDGVPTAAPDGVPTAAPGGVAPSACDAVMAPSDEEVVAAAPDGLLEGAAAGVAPSAPDAVAGAAAGQEERAAEPDDVAAAAPAQLVTSAAPDGAVMAALTAVPNGVVAGPADAVPPQEPSLTPQLILGSQPQPTGDRTGSEASQPAHRRLAPGGVPLEDAQAWMGPNCAPYVAPRPPRAVLNVEKAGVGFTAWPDITMSVLQHGLAILTARSKLAAPLAGGNWTTNDYAWLPIPEPATVDSSENVQCLLPRARNVFGDPAALGVVIPEAAAPTTGTEAARQEQNGASAHVVESGAAAAPGPVGGEAAATTLVGAPQACASPFCAEVAPSAADQADGAAGGEQQGEGAVPQRGVEDEASGEFHDVCSQDEEFYLQSGPDFFTQPL